jgi:hypothetical protein
MKTPLTCGCISEETAQGTRVIVQICERHKNQVDEFGQMKLHIMDFLKKNNLKVLIASLREDGNDIDIKVG